MALQTTVRQNAMVGLRRAVTSIALVAVATLARGLLDPILGDAYPFISYFAAIAASAYMGGFWPGLLAIALSYVAADWFFIPPRGGLALLTGGGPAVIGFFTFIMVGLIITGLSEALHRARRAAALETRRSTRILESISDGFVALDANFCFVFLNPQAERLLGRTAAELLGQSHWKLFPAAVGSDLERAYRQAMDQRVAVTLEHFYEPWQKWYHVTASPAVDAGIVISFQDITERKQASQRLDDQRQWLRVTLESIGDAVIATDREARIAFMNAVAEELTGWLAADAVGRHLADVFVIFNEKTGRPATSPLEQALSTGHVVGLANHTVLRSRAGAERPIDDSAAPIRDSTGTIVGVVLVFRDATEARRSAEVAERFAAIVEHSDDAIIGESVDGMITSWNAAAERLYGYSAGEAVGQPIAMLTPADKRDELSELLSRLRAGTGVSGHETTRLRKDGSVVDVSITISPIRDRDGEVIGASKICRDISYRRRAEEQARQADQRKDEFLAILAHELRNPLAPIVNAVQLLHLQGPADPELVEARDIIDRQARHLTRLVDDLLDVSRITRGKLSLRIERITLQAIFQSVAEATKPIVDAFGHQLTVTMPEEPLYLDADPTRLDQVFFNLTSNAAKYTPKGGQIWLTAKQEDGQVVVSVRDSGIGIPPDHLASIFDIFSQVEPALERSQGGLGIGLSLVKGIVELHGGSVHVRSEGRDMGSEFTVVLPPAKLTAPSIEGPSDKKPSVAKRCKVLVVDDNLDSARTMAKMLRIMGHEVSTAADGLAALNAAAAIQPEVLLLDIGLPKLNGYEVAQRIRQEPWGRSMAIIAQTGWGQEDDKQRALLAGFDHHLTKPVDPAALSKLLALIVPPHDAVDGVDGA
ncbi:MAG TPA: PAS domain S-box protein [Lacipirellulaceae bacterium]|nr:PAS domain S-box protein [Lacipirellulaceae bacterium]